MFGPCSHNTVVRAEGPPARGGRLGGTGYTQLHGRARPPPAGGACDGTASHNPMLLMRERIIKSSISSGHSVSKTLFVTSLCLETTGCSTFRLFYNYSTGFLHFSKLNAYRVHQRTICLYRKPNLNVWVPPNNKYFSTKLEGSVSNKLKIVLISFNYVLGTAVHC